MTLKGVKSLMIAPKIREVLSIQLKKRLFRQWILLERYFYYIKYLFR